MDFKPQDLAPDELAFRFETNDTISAAAVGTFLREVERIARLKSHFGPEAEVRILDIGTGSLWGKIKIIGGVAVGVATIGSFGLAIEERLNQPTPVIAQCVAEMALDSGVVSATIVTQDCHITVHTKDLPAIDYVKHKRVAADEKRQQEKLEDQAGSLRLGDTTRPVAGTAPRPYGEGEYGEGRFGGPIRISTGFQGSRDKRGAVNLIGKLSRQHNDDPIIFTSPDGSRLGVELADDLAPEDLLYDTQVVVRANHDPEHDWLLIWEVWAISQI